MAGNKRNDLIARYRVETWKSDNDRKLSRKCLKYLVKLQMLALNYSYPENTLCMSNTKDDMQKSMPKCVWLSTWKLFFFLFFCRIDLIICCMTCVSIHTFESDHKFLVTKLIISANKREGFYLRKPKKNLKYIHALKMKTENFAIK